MQHLDNASVGGWRNGCLLECEALPRLPRSPSTHNPTQHHNFTHNCLSRSPYRRTQGILCTFPVFIERYRDLRTFRTRRVEGALLTSPNTTDAYSSKNSPWKAESNEVQGSTIIQRSSTCLLRCSITKMSRQWTAHCFVTARRFNDLTSKILPWSTPQSQSVKTLPTKESSLSTQITRRRF